MKSENNTKTTKNAPFFARKANGTSLVIKTSVKAGKGAAQEQCNK